MRSDSSDTAWASPSEDDDDEYTEENESEEPYSPRRVKTSDDSCGNSPVASIHKLLAERETGAPCTPPQTINAKLASHFIPETATCICSHHDRGYLGKWSNDGRLYATAWQGSRTIMLLDQTRGMRPAKTIHCRTLRWTVTDLDVTKDNRFLMYSTIAPVIHLASIDNNETTSIANVTDIHESIYLGEEDVEYGEGVWSLRWGPDAREILAGSSSSVYIYDMPTQRVSRRLRYHQDDVNAIEYADETGNIFFSGSDDSMIFAYDLRVKPQPIGSFVGHLSGITYLDSDGSGQWLLSQSKDQTAKLWDLRMMASFAAAKKERTMRDVPRIGFDYRWQAPRRGGATRAHPRDGSVTTFRGHAVLQTLIRARFSPLYTNQAYVYSGSACGSVYIWDRYRGGEPLRVLENAHDDVVRDVEWHPHSPLIASLGFDGQVFMWSC